MNTMKSAVGVLAIGATMLLAACAVSPEIEARRQAVDADIDAILSQTAAPELGETQRCLSDNQYDSFRALDEKHILFEGLRDRRWINTLTVPNPDLRYGDVLVVKQFNAMRVCNGDRFVATDWFDYPWYRRWPWNWGPSWSTGMQGTLGQFQPVTADQVAEIEAVLHR